LQGYFEPELLRVDVNEETVTRLHLIEHKLLPILINILLPHRLVEYHQLVLLILKERQILLYFRNTQTFQALELLVLDLEHLAHPREEPCEVLLLRYRNEMPIMGHGFQRDEDVKHSLVVLVALAHADDLLVVGDQVVDSSVVLPGSALGCCLVVSYVFGSGGIKNWQ